MSEKENIQFQHRWTGEVLFECEVDASLPTRGLKVGAAVKLAVKMRANLTGANLANAILANANLARANLADAILADADLTGANLAGANLARAYLADANLDRVNLADAHLAGANLTRADLSGADLTGARMARANLDRARMANANLAGANSIIRIDCGHEWPLILRNGDPVMVSCGCRWMMPEEMRGHWQQHPNNHRRDVMIPALAAALEIAKAKGWRV